MHGDTEQRAICHPIKRFLSLAELHFVILFYLVYVLVGNCSALVTQIEYFIICNIYVHVYHMTYMVISDLEYLVSNMTT